MTLAATATTTGTTVTDTGPTDTTAIGTGTTGTSSTASGPTDTARTVSGPTDTGPTDTAPSASPTWTRAGLPGPVVASAGVPPSESVTSVTTVVLAFVPLWLWTERAPWGFALAAVAAAALSYVLWARRVAVGEDYLAVRQLGRYHVARADAFRDVRLSPTQHGGTLRVQTDDGRCMRLRRAEYADPAVNAALRSLCANGQATCDDAVEDLLALAPPSRHRYLADAYS